MSTSTTHHVIKKSEPLMPTDTPTALDAALAAQGARHIETPREVTNDDDSAVVEPPITAADEDGTVEPTAESDSVGSPNIEDPVASKRRPRWQHLMAYALLPGLALLLAMGAGYLKWWGASASDVPSASAQSVRAASEGTVAMLSYRPDNVDKTLGAARDRLTGDFRDAYTKLINDVVIPGAKQKEITATANVNAAASVSATNTHAVALVFVNQTVTIGTEAPTATASSVRVTLDKVRDRWLISQFEPV
jgi:Mce-associated membrane protein